MSGFVGVRARVRARVRVGEGRIRVGRGDDARVALGLVVLTDLVTVRDLIVVHYNQTQCQALSMKMTGKFRACMGIRYPRHG